MQTAVAVTAKGNPGHHLAYIKIQLTPISLLKIGDWDSNLQVCVKFEGQTSDNSDCRHRYGHSNRRARCLGHCTGRTA